MEFPLYPLLGGVAIGVSAIVLLLFLGRIAGISGITWGAITQAGNERSWRVVFLLGLLIGAFLYHALSGAAYPAINENFPLAAVAGLFVGVGVKIGNGCTSGHGVCGIGRLSNRSIAATVTFMTVAIATVALVNHLL